MPSDWRRALPRGRKANPQCGFFLRPVTDVGIWQPGWRLPVGRMTARTGRHQDSSAHDHPRGLNSRCQQSGQNTRGQVPSRSDVHTIASRRGPISGRNDTNGPNRRPLEIVARKRQMPANRADRPPQSPSNAVFGAGSHQAVGRGFESLRPLHTKALQVNGFPPVLHGCRRGGVSHGVPTRFGSGAPRAPVRWIRRRSRWTGCRGANGSWARTISRFRRRRVGRCRTRGCGGVSRMRCRWRVRRGWRFHDLRHSFGMLACRLPALPCAGVHGSRGRGDDNDLGSSRAEAGCGGQAVGARGG